MYIDATLMIADAQESTVTAASTSFIDTVHKGDSYEGAWFVVRIDTACTSGGSATVSFALETDTDSGFATAKKTLVETGAIAVASLVAGYTYAVRIPFGAYRYLRGYATVAVADLLTGKWDMFIAKDVDLKMVSQI